MNKNIRYTKAPKDIEDSLDRSVEVPDFLPPPEVLACAPVKIRITISLDEKIIDFFQREAKKHKGKYQTMINNALSAYVKTADERILKQKQKQRKFR